MSTGLFRFVTVHAFDRHSDGRTEKPWQYRTLHYMQSCDKNRPMVSGENGVE